MVAMMHKLPISIVKENLDISLTQAILVSRMIKKVAMIHTLTSYPNTYCDRPLKKDTINEMKEIVKESWVNAIIKSSIFLAFGPRTLSVIREYDARPSDYPVLTSFNPATVYIIALIIMQMGEKTYPPCENVFGKSSIIIAQ